MLHQARPLPPLGPLRFTTPSNIMRMGAVSYAAFASEPLFRDIYPEYEKHAHGILQLECQHLMKMMQSPDRVLLVIQDTYNTEEIQYFDTSISHVDDNAPSHSPISNDYYQVVVGFAAWSFNSESNPHSNHRLGALDTISMDTMWPDLDHPLTLTPSQIQHTVDYTIRLSAT